MVRRLGIFAAALVSLVSQAAAAAPFPGLRDIKVVPGRCTPSTRLDIAAAGSASFEHIAFACDTLIVSYHEGGGSVMLQFASSTATDGRLLGFAGTMASREMLRVQRIYLAGGAPPARANEGHCRLFWRGAKLTSVACGARADAEGKRVVPLVAFEAR